MTLPPRIRQPLKEAKLKRRFPAHQKWVRGHKCVLWKTGNCVGPITFFHVDRAGYKGVSIKVPDWFGLSMCQDHHNEYGLGPTTFEEKYKMDLVALAEEFALRSPKSYEMRMARQELEAFYA